MPELLLTLLAEAEPSAATSGRHINWDATAASSRRTGSRGEQFAYHQERLRVTEFGFDPDDVVHWQSQIQEDANYDIRSVDRDGVPIYIEVKATESSDPHQPAEISDAELSLAVAQGDRYLTYRVLNANAARPRLISYRNPIGLLGSGLAAIRVSGAKLYLAPKEH
jgi:hypothetical protein